MGTHIEFSQPNGATCRGYLSNAAASGAPGVVVIQEWWGLQEQIKGLCDRFALAGFDALAPDLYSGTVVPYHDTEAASREMASLNFLEATDQKVRAAAQFLGRNGAKVGLTGFCLGGAVTVIGCARIAEIAAGVVFYGIPPDEVASPRDVQVPIQCHFASRDDWCTPDLVNRFESDLKSADKTFELYRYEAEHAFANEQRTSVHNRAAAELAWGRAKTFLQDHLR